MKSNLCRLKQVRICVEITAENIIVRIADVNESIER